MTQNNTFATPVGRIVYNRIWDRSTIDAEGGPLTNRDGSPRSEQVLLHAIEKNHPNVNAFFQLIQTAAKSVWPGEETKKQDFAWKMYDGDDPKYAGKEGYPGHWVFKYTNGLPENARVYSHDMNDIITDPRACKCGDYVACVIQVSSNKSTRNPGVFLNLKSVRFMYPGTEIVSVDYRAIMSSSDDTYVPAGATATPGGPMTGGPITPGGPMTGGSSAAGGPPMAPGFTNPDPKYIMTEKAAGYSREQYLEKGWTDEMLCNTGMMIVNK